MLDLRTVLTPIITITVIAILCSIVLGFFVCYCLKDYRNKLKRGDTSVKRLTSLRTVEMNVGEITGERFEDIRMKQNNSTILAPNYQLDCNEESTLRTDMKTNSPKYDGFN